MAPSAADEAAETVRKAVAAAQARHNTSRNASRDPGASSSSAASTSKSPTTAATPYAAPLYVYVYLASLLAFAAFRRAGDARAAFAARMRPPAQACQPFVPLLPGAMLQPGDFLDGCVGDCAGPEFEKHPCVPYRCALPAPTVPETTARRHVSATPHLRARLSSHERARWRSCSGQLSGGGESFRRREEIDAPSATPMLTHVTYI